MVQVRGHLSRRQRSRDWLREYFLRNRKYLFYGAVIVLLCLYVYLSISFIRRQQQEHQKEHQVNIIFQIAGFIVSKFFSYVSLFFQWYYGSSSADNSQNKNNNPVSIGVYYYPWWKEDRRFDKNYVRDFLEPPQRPLLGNYWSKNATIVDTHLKWMNEYGISHLVASWWGKDGIEDITVRDYLLKSPQLGDIQVAVLWESIGRIGTDMNGWLDCPFDDEGEAEKKLVDDIDHLATTIFSHPNYMKVDGKPVVFLYTTRIYSGQYKRAIQKLRRTIREKHKLELYLVADEVYWTAFPNLERIQLFDALTAYNMYLGSFLWHGGYPDKTHYIDDSETMYNLFQAIANYYGLDFIPNVIPGYNDRGIRLEVDQYAIPHEFSKEYAGSGKYTTLKQYLNLAYRITRNAAPEKKSSALSLIMITSWNEHHEDTGIEPIESTEMTVPATTEPFLRTQGYTYMAHGFELLKVVRHFLTRYNKEQ